ncbi:MAG: hypothetical protein Q7U57_14805 [Methylovulum sp.]|nr:hypothetical protein [Methylovulum sp.]
MRSSPYSSVGCEQTALSFAHHLPIKAVGRKALPTRLVLLDLGAITLAPKKMFIASRPYDAIQDRLQRIEKPLELS